jgi:hypothetical protein
VGNAYGRKLSRLASDKNRRIIIDLARAYSFPHLEKLHNGEE